MKILMVLDHEFPTDVRVENEATALIAAGHEVHIACYTQKEKPANEVFKSIQIHRVEISNLMYTSGTLGPLRSSRLFVNRPRGTSPSNPPAKR